MTPSQEQAHRYCEKHLKIIHWVNNTRLTQVGHLFRINQGSIDRRQCWSESGHSVHALCHHGCLHLPNAGGFHAPPAITHQLAVWDHDPSGNGITNSTGESSAMAVAL